MRSVPLPREHEAPFGRPVSHRSFRPGTPREWGRLPGAIGPRTEPASRGRPPRRTLAYQLHQGRPSSCRGQVADRRRAAEPIEGDLIRTQSERVGLSRRTTPTRAGHATCWPPSSGRDWGAMTRSTMGYRRGDDDVSRPQPRRNRINPAVCRQSVRPERRDLDSRWQPRIAIRIADNAAL